MSLCRPVLTVSDPKRHYIEVDTYVLDLLHCKVCVCRNPDCLWSYVDDDHYGPRDEHLQQVVDLLV